MWILLGQNTDPAESRRLLATLRTMLDALPPAIAAREVQTFLTSKRDAATSLDLTVKRGGTLGEASTLRVFLLDYLGQIDRAAAANFGREILSTPTAPDEWAVSLRNVAWADASAETRNYLTGKVREMMANPAWRQNPTAGFLEAFDVIVHTRAFALAPQLTELVRDRENRAVAYAAFLTLDRLTLADPLEALASLAAQPQWMAGREKTRANFFARADVRDLRQKELVESYLLDPRRTAEELQTFAGLFPSANYLVSNNLLTTFQAPTHAELAARDRGTLEVVEAWLADERLAAVHPHLGTVCERLRGFVAPAETQPIK